MIPFYVMVVSIASARLVGALGWQPLDDWSMATRVGLGIMFIFTGLSHFGRQRADFIRMVPPALPRPELLVTFTGLAELAGAAGLLLNVWARLAAYGLTLLLVAMFPANVYAARVGHRIRGRTATRLVLRLPLQLVWIALLLWSAPR